MKLMKYVLALAIAVCATASVANAQAFIGGGSSGIALEVGQAQVVAVGQAHGNAFCLYTHHTSTLHSGSTVNAQDNRLGPAATTESGDFYLVWGPLSGNCQNPDLANPFYLFTNLDSTLGNRGYFEVDPGNTTGCAAGAGYCQQLVLAAADDTPSLCPGTACPDNLLNFNPPAAPFNNMADNATPPASLIAAIHNKHWNFAASDGRPEDAKFQTFRLLSACNAWVNRQPFDQIQRQVQGLGYAAGASITDDFGAGKSFHVKDFNISGNDPITNQPVPAYTTVAIGAQPIIVVVGPNPSPSGTGIALATDIPGFVAANFFSGVTARATDLIGPTGAWAVTTLIREPLSGTYTNFEMDAINNSQYHTSMDIGNCSPAPGNPLHIVSANGVGLEGGAVQAFRRRVIGTGQMISTLQGAVEGGNNPSKTYMGFLFWSAANGATLSNTKYLKFDGIDPILANSYSTNGTLPGSNGPGDPCAGNIVNCPAGLINFAGLNNGDYGLWAVERFVAPTPTPAGITALNTAAQTLNSSQTDFVPVTKLLVWRSHFALPAINVNAGANGPTINVANDLCNPAGGALAEAGGDAGGAKILKQANADFCSDYNNNTGLISKTQ